MNFSLMDFFYYQGSKVDGCMIKVQVDICNMLIDMMRAIWDPGPCSAGKFC